MAGSDFGANAERRADFHQDVDFDQDDIFAALILDIDDPLQIADIDIESHAEADFDQDVDLDEDDVFGALVLDEAGVDVEGFFLTDFGDLGFFD